MTPKSKSKTNIESFNIKIKYPACSIFRMYALFDFRELRDSLEQMKIEIDTLSSEKRNVMAEFRLQEMAHKKYISERREEAKLKRKEEKEAAEAQKIKEW